ncbi:MAG: TetR/AcrR family transcriptional regulator C-terminal domain-containing protein [Erysipelotrichaceae bacterium]|nr:TetR/AcrR family transcriptional regulator C-terminal domain-containing protein [Erysipelotrichaceae bacterium]
MNKTNNQRRKETISAIRKAYMDLVISRSDIDTISVSDVCKKAGINRTTFYAIYEDLDDLKETIERWMIEEFLSSFQNETQTLRHSFDFTTLFRSIKENQIFYKIYFKLNFDFKSVFVKNEPTQIWTRYFTDESTIKYHIEFFSAGITAIIQMWLNEGCPGDPERMSNIIVEEYQKNNNYS